MNLNHLQSEEDLPTTHITDEEAHAMVELWASRQPATQAINATASVRDFAEGLNMSPAEADALLQEVRRNAEAKRLAEEEAEQRVQERARLKAEEHIRQAELLRRELEAETATLNAKRIYDEERSKYDMQKIYYPVTTNTGNQIDEEAYTRKLAGFIFLIIFCLNGYPLRSSDIPLSQSVTANSWKSGSYNMTVDRICMDYPDG